MVERLLGLEAGFRRALLKAFRTAPHQVDFSRTEQATDVINAWVSDRTAGTSRTDRLTGQRRSH